MISKENNNINQSHKFNMKKKSTKTACMLRGPVNFFVEQNRLLFKSNLCKWSNPRIMNLKHFTGDNNYNKNGFSITFEGGKPWKRKLHRF